MRTTLTVPKPWNGDLLPDKPFPKLPQPIADKDVPDGTGFEDDPRPVPCTHPQHDPPQHIVIPHGKILRHKCPGCGRVARVYPTIIRW